MLKFLIPTSVALAFASPTVAHEFEVTFIVPAGSEAVAEQAFLLASAERDGHADETSEGHLGGVDSQLAIITSGQVLPASDIVVVIGAVQMPGSGGFWGLPVSQVSEAARSAFLASDAPFASRFAGRYGQAPGEIATLVYVAARLIDVAIREQDGVGDINALENAVKDY